MPLKEIIPYVFLDIAIVIVAARLAGHWFRRMGQPAVIGEIVAGVMLGPTLLGLLPGDLHLVLFPPDVRPYLSVIAQVGLVLFMFLVGLEVDLSLIRSHRRTATVVSLSSIIVPFGLGALLATGLYANHSTVNGETVPQLAFVLFLGIAMSITAFPVLARILTERRMHRIPIGVLALSCAAIDDVVAWSLLAIVIAVAVGGTLGGVGTIVGLTVLFAAFMFLVVRPLLGKLVDRYRAAGRLTPDMLAVVLVGLLLSAWATELIGVHAIFGAFLFGAIMPRAEPGLTRAVLERLEQVALTLLLPVFFVVAGLQVNVGAIGLRGIGELGLILLVAIGGKMIGAVAAARLQRVPWRPASALGVLMNTRGLTEIVILQVGAQLGVLDQNLFTLMVLMALITTIMAEPLLRRVYPDRMVRRDIAEVERAEHGDRDAFTVLVLLPPATTPASAARLVATARGLTGHQSPSRVLLCRLLVRDGGPLELASGLGPDLAAVATAGDELRALAVRAGGPGPDVSVVVRFSADPAAEIQALVETLGVDVVVAEESAAEASESRRSRDEAAASSRRSRDEAAASSRRSRDEAAAPAATEQAAPVPAAGRAAVVLVRLPASDQDTGDTAGATGTGSTSADRREGVTALVDGGAGGRGVLRLAAQLAVHHATTLTVAGLDGRRGAGRQANAAVTQLVRAGVPATVASIAPTGAEAVLVVPDGAMLGDVAGSERLTVRPTDADTDDDLARVLGRVTVAPSAQTPAPQLERPTGDQEPGAPIPG